MTAIELLTGTRTRCISQAIECVAGGILLLILCCITPTQINAQTLHGTTQLTLTAGHQTNPYNDAMLRSWDPTIAPVFVGLTPQGMLSWNSPRLRTHLRASARLDARAVPGQNDYTTALPLVQSDGRVLHAITDALEIGMSGGARRYRLQTDQDGVWVLPTVQWRVTETVRLDGYAGLSAQRYGDENDTTTDWQPTFIAQSAAHWWMRNDLRTTFRIYGSQGTPAIASGRVEGTGGGVSSTWWPTPTWSITVNGQLTQNRYVLDAADAQTTRLMQTSIEATWRPTTSLDLFAQAATTRSLDDSRPEDGTSHHAAVGLRLRTQTLLAGANRSSGSDQQLWTAEGTTVHVSIPAPNDEQLYLTGDFNGWDLPGIPLSPTDDGRHEATLELPPGQYSYRVHRQKDDANADSDTPCWIDLPPYARTEDDAFGETNGVIIVDP